ncbi:Uncharacterised protein [Bordetella pertussis]|nr:Uncharacterised protein [Bordetella pertussis]
MDCSKRCQRDQSNSGWVRTRSQVPRPPLCETPRPWVVRLSLYRPPASPDRAGSSPARACGSFSWPAR